MEGAISFCPIDDFPSTSSELPAENMLLSTQGSIAVGAIWLASRSGLNHMVENVQNIMPDGASSSVAHPKAVHGMFR